ncbi:hypothetical protein Pst134EB_014267 [Puccinia striiformis f. sp. tritici]|nr:hypothetical protein Pst134EB_014267 [Puccinia striiformis f. sp. tritici]
MKSAVQDAANKIVLLKDLDTMDGQKRAHYKRKFQLIYNQEDAKNTEEKEKMEMENTKEEKEKAEAEAEAKADANKKNSTDVDVENVVEDSRLLDQPKSVDDVQNVEQIKEKLLKMNPTQRAKGLG